MAEIIDLNWGLVANPSREVNALAARHKGIQVRLPPESDILLALSHFCRYPLLAFSSFLRPLRCHFFERFPSST